MDGKRSLKKIRRWMIAICKVRNLDPSKENIVTIQELVWVDKTLSTLDEFINGRNNT